MRINLCVTDVLHSEKDQLSRKHWLSFLIFVILVMTQFVRDFFPYLMSLLINPVMKSHCLIFLMSAFYCSYELYEYVVLTSLQQGCTLMQTLIYFKNKPKKLGNVNVLFITAFISLVVILKFRPKKIWAIQTSETSQRILNQPCFHRCRNVLKALFSDGLFRSICNLRLGARLPTDWTFVICFLFPIANAYRDSGYGECEHHRNWSF